MEDPRISTGKLLNTTKTDMEIRRNGSDLGRVKLYETPVLIRDYFVEDFDKLKRKNTEVDLESIEILSRKRFGKVMIVKPENINPKSSHNDKFQIVKTIRREKFQKYPFLYDPHGQKVEPEFFANPFLLEAFAFYQTNNRNYYTMPIHKETLYDQLNRDKRLTETRTKIYAAQIVCAIGHLHSYELAFPFVFPENILIDEAGFVHLNYFGKVFRLSANFNDIYEFFDLPIEYYAPEVLRKTDLTLAIDWWSFGILLFELLVGAPPFNTSNPDLMKSLLEKETLKFPAGLHLSEDVQDLITRLLQPDLTERIGSVNDFFELASHPWFKSINWESLIAKKEDLEYHVAKPANQNSTLANYSKMRSLGLSKNSEYLTDSLETNASLRIH
jgi:serum/glucocorticoid-regulated kinase 2